ncbi:hypothetical protein [Krasilnikovia sp. MM14-A1004]|uniref:hypothetical protein n=1 Tax=Krasilnikovia sp. MM14-A1004 TaxID=3373541 RepID=UPI00399C57C9
MHKYEWGYSVKNRVAKVVAGVAVTVGVLLGTAGVAQAGPRHYTQYNCWWEKHASYDAGGNFEGTRVSASCPSGAPKNQWRARVTWHSHDYQYSSIQFNWLNQGDTNSGVLYSGQGVVDEVTYWEFRDRP